MPMMIVVLDNGGDVLVATRMPEYDGSSSLEIRTTGPVYLDDGDQAAFDEWLDVTKPVPVVDFSSIDSIATPEPAL
jgi:hypothetical protein